MSASVLIKHKAAYSCSERTAKRSWGMKWLEGVDAENMAFSRNP